MITLDVRTLGDRVGQEIAVGTWTTISQAQIDQFAEATGDRQWIHVDAARTKAESPFKTTIAHGFLTLSLLSAFLREAIEFTGLRMAINYGLNKVRFVAPVVSGSRVRARIVAGAFEEVAGGAIQVTWAIAVERENSEKPACVAEWIVRYYPNGD
ncbi:MAG TPA: MaoC family dehydratase [Vicinamibacterales bacterium]|nr:MaoC family dehydratase [Vicinamibacterales bacterium]